MGTLKISYNTIGNVFRWVGFCLGVKQCGGTLLVPYSIGAGAYSVE